MAFSLFVLRNERGTELANFYIRSNLVITNTLFQHPERKLYTWKSPGDACRNQIDYIMINTRFRNCVKQVKTYPGADICSDHNPVVMKIKIKLKKLESKQQNPNLELNKLKEEHFKECYNISVSNKYNALTTEQQPQREEDQIEQEWKAIKDSMTSAASDVLPKKKRERKQDWMTEEILEKMKKRKEVKNRDMEQYKRLKREIEAMCADAKENYWNEKCSEIESLESRHQYKEMHKKIKEITDDKTKNKGSNCIKDKNGNVLFEEEAIKERWVEYTSELYNDQRGDPPPINTDTADENSILLEEVEKAIRDLKTGKATGPDHLAMEMLRALDEEVHRIHALVNKIYRTGHIPPDMNESTFVCLPKKAKATLCSECTEH